MPSVRFFDVAEEIMEFSGYLVFFSNSPRDFLPQLKMCTSPALKSVVLIGCFMMIRHAEIERLELIYYLGNSLIGRFMGLEDEISNTP